ERYPFPGGEGGLHAVEGIVDGVGIVAAPHEIERGGADLRGGHLPAILVILPSVVEEVLHLVHVVASVGNLHSGARLRHYRSYAPVVAAASCPHAPSMSLPRVSRTVVEIPASRSLATNSASTSGSLAVQMDPGVGLSGIGLTCTHPRPHLLSSSPSNSARQAWSFISLMRAYSMLTRRPVTSKYSRAASSSSVTFHRELMGMSSSRSSSSGA